MKPYITVFFNICTYPIEEFITLAPLANMPLHRTWLCCLRFMVHPLVKLYTLAHILITQKYVPTF